MKLKAKLSFTTQVLYPGANRPIMRGIQAGEVITPLDGKSGQISDQVMEFLSLPEPMEQYFERIEDGAVVGQVIGQAAPEVAPEAAPEVETPKSAAKGGKKAKTVVEDEPPAPPAVEPAVDAAAATEPPAASDESKTDAPDAATGAEN
jgi:hypothetical protein